MDFVKKTTFGYRSVAVESIDSTEYEYVVLPKGEYQSTMKTFEALRLEVRNAENRAVQLVRDQEIRHKKEVDELKQKLEKAEEEANHYFTMNEGLQKIFRKKANKERDLRPKTQHTGYVVLQCSEKEYSWFTGSKKKERHTTTLWETTLQTPYSLDFNLNQVEELTSKELFSNGLVVELGIKYWFEGRTYESVKERMMAKYSLSEEVFEGINVWMKDKNRHKINAREGFWEVTLVHTHCITGIPEDMRLPAKKSKSKEKSEE